jgi:hypothetical protein
MTVAQALTQGTWQVIASEIKKVKTGRSAWHNFSAEGI